jgi:hypothetical protein
VPVRRHTDKRRPQISDALWHLLNDLPLTADHRAERYFFKPEEIREAWAQFREETLAEWAQEHPGTRPSRWWKFDAPRIPVGTWPGCYWDGQLPEPRRRLGGVGTPAHEVLAFVPRFPFGVPDRWVDAWAVDYYNGRAVDVHGNPIGTQYHEGHFSGVAIDPDDPPAYESQAAYLARLDLLLPGERKRLTEADFEPVLVAAALDIELDEHGRIVE